MKNWLKEYGATIVVLAILIAAVVLGVMLYNNNQKYELAMENSYNYSFYEFINYVDSILLTNFSFFISYLSMGVHKFRPFFIFVSHLQNLCLPIVVISCLDHIQLFVAVFGLK